MDHDIDSEAEDVTLYSQERVHEMVLKKYRALRANGNLQSITDIYLQLPQQRLVKQDYIFSFDVIKNNLQEKMNDCNRLQKVLQNQIVHIKDIEIRYSKDIAFQNIDLLYTEKLQSGLPIFKSIQFLRYQDNLMFEEYFGQEKAFIVDQQNIEFAQVKHEISKIKLFLEVEKNLPKVNVQFKNTNTLDIKYERYPTLIQIEKRADAMAKLLLYNIFAEEHRKLKQIWKNDPRYQNMQKNEKKNSEMQAEKIKEEPSQEEEGTMEKQVNKVLLGIQQRANLLAHDQFRQLNGQKAVETKKSLQKLKKLIQSQPNHKIQLKILIAYKQKKNW